MNVKGFFRAVFGLNLIEYMILMAITGIIAAIAIPAWQDYECKAYHKHCREHTQQTAAKSCH